MRAERIHTLGEIAVVIELWGLPVNSEPCRLRPNYQELTKRRFRMKNSLQLAHQWWDSLDQIDRQRVWDARDSYLAGDLVESMANAGVPVVSDGRWSCVSVGPTGFTVPLAVQQLLERLSQVTHGEDALAVP
jgi:hypothetical protein